MRPLHVIAVAVGLVAGFALGAPSITRLITVLDTGNVTGTLPVANGGTGLTASVEDAVLVGSGTSTFENKTLPSCSGATNALAYNSTTNAFSCNTIAGGASPLTTKGDLYTYTTVDARLGVGADNLCLIADSTQATGLRWGSCSAGGGLTFGEVQRLVFLGQ